MITVLQSLDTAIYNYFRARLLPLTRHYHQCAETFWMGRDTGEAERNGAMSKTNYAHT